MNHSRRNFWLGLALAISFTIHLLGLVFTEISDDEPAFADFAIHNQLASYIAILGKPHTYFSNFSYGGVPGFTTLLKWQIDLWGLGLWQIRMGNFLAAFLAVILLIALINRLKLPLIASFGVLLFTMSHLFWMTTHACRPEGTVLLLSTINFFLMMLGTGRVSAVLAGLCSAITLMFHPAGSYLFLASGLFVALSRFHLKFPLLRSIWWIIGGAIGALIVIHNLNINNWVQFYQIQNNGYGLMEPALIRWKWDVLSIWGNSFELLRMGTLNKEIMLSPWNSVLLGCMISSVAWQIRRLRSNPPAETAMALIFICLFFSYALFTGSTSARNHLYILAWLWINLFIVIHKLLKGSLRPDRPDIFIFTASLLTVLAFQWNPTWFNSSLMYFVLGSILVVLISLRHMEFKMTGSGILYMILLGVCAGDFFFYPYNWNRWLLRQKPAHVYWNLLLFSIPWILLRLRSKGTTVLISLILGIVGINVAINLKFNWDDYRTGKSYLSGLAGLNSAIPDKRRVVGPGILTLLEPSLAAVPPRALQEFKGHNPRFNMAMALFDYKPTFVLWPSSSLEDLENDIMRIRRKPVHLFVNKSGRKWRTVYGDFIEVRLMKK